MEEMERVEIDDPPQLEVPSTSLMPSEGVQMRSSFPSVMMPVLNLNVAQLSIGGKDLIIEAPSVQVLSLSYEGDDYNFSHELAPSVASKLSYMMEEEMQVVAPETELPSERL